MPLRRFHRGLYLSVAVGTTVFAGSVLIHGELTRADDQRDREASRAVAAQTAAGVRTELTGILSALSIAATSPPVRDQQMAGLRSGTLLEAVVVVDSGGGILDVLFGPAGAVQTPLLPCPCLDAARDSGTARLGEWADDRHVLAAAPMFRGAPRGPAERRELIDGYLVGLVDMERLLATRAVTAGFVTRLDEDLSEAGVGSVGSGPSTARESVSVGGRSYMVAVAQPGAPSRPPLMPLVGAVTGLLVAVSGARTALGRRQAEESAIARAAEVTLVADVGTVLQQSLDLEVILPAVTIRVAEQLDLLSCAVLRADRAGRLVRAFVHGPPPPSSLENVVQIRVPPGSVAGGEPVVIPLQRGGRLTGAMWIRPRRALDEGTVRSLHTAADLVAAALANADAYDQERETVRRLEELDRMKNRFIGTVSHEMRTSASAISGFAGLLASRWELLDEPERRDLVNRLERNGQSLVAVVEDFLDFSRLERRSPSSEPAPASLSDMVAAAVADLAPSARDHVLVTQITPGVGALVDRGVVDRILSNLVSNALKYSPPGSTVTVTVEPAEGEARLMVDDEGAGIVPDERERVFEPFYRAPHSSVAGTRGAGIGLAVVKEVADRVQARVMVEQSPGGGARLVVAFRGAPVPALSPALTPGGTHAP